MSRSLLFFAFSCLFCFPQYSQACDISQYPGVCPDPHGLLKKYEADLKKALNKADMSGSGWEGPGAVAMYALTGIFFFIALCLGVTIFRKRRRLAQKSKAPPPPPIVKDGPSVGSSVAASSAAPSVHSVQKQEGVDYQAPDVTKQTSLAGSIISSVAASVSSVLPNASPDGVAM